MMCVYCNNVFDNKLLIGGDGVFATVEVYAYGDKGLLAYFNSSTGESDFKRINYCPVCGRNLNGVKA